MTTLSNGVISLKKIQTMQINFLPNEFNYLFFHNLFTKFPIGDSTDTTPSQLSQQLCIAC